MLKEGERRASAEENRTRWRSHTERGSPRPGMKKGLLRRPFRLILVLSSQCEVSLSTLHGAMHVCLQDVHWAPSMYLCICIKLEAKKDRSEDPVPAEQPKRAV